MVLRQFCWSFFVVRESSCSFKLLKAWIESFLRYFWFFILRLDAHLHLFCSFGPLRLQKILRFCWPVSSRRPVNLQELVVYSSNLFRFSCCSRAPNSSFQWSFYINLETTFAWVLQQTFQYLLWYLHLRSARIVFTWISESLAWWFLWIINSCLSSVNSVFWSDRLLFKTIDTPISFLAEIIRTPPSIVNMMF